MDSRTSFRHFLALGIIFGAAYMCTGLSWCKERRRELRDQREGLRQEFNATWSNLNVIKTNWNSTGMQDRLAKISESILIVTILKAKVETFKRNFYDFCQNCAWVQVDYLGRKQDMCPSFKSKIKDRISGLNRALHKLNKYMQPVEIGSDDSGGSLKAVPISAPGDYTGSLDWFP